MIGAIIGDIVGSRFEFNNFKSKKFDLFHKDCFFTDDTVMSLAICKAFLEVKKANFSDLQAKTILYMQDIGREYPFCGYGGMFYKWIFGDNPQPYNSFGNGAAMRVSSCAYVAKSLDEAKKLAHICTVITHNHPEGLKGAEALTVATFLALHGATIPEIKAEIVKNYYPLDFCLDEIRPSYTFNETCQNTVPQALVAFFESKSFEDAIRNTISLGGDADTLGAITGAVAGAYYGVSEEFRNKALSYLDGWLEQILLDFEKRFVKKN